MQRYKILNFLFFGLYLLFNPRLIFLWIINGLYPPVFVQYDWVKHYNISTIIDVGSHQGRVSKILRYFFPQAYIYAFEPNVSLHKSFYRNLGYTNVILETFALSDKQKKRSFFKSSDTTLSSIMPLINPNFRLGIKIKNVKSETNSTTLDKYFETKAIKGEVFLKIDTEGAEGLVLKGAQKTLSKIAIIHIETYFKKVYKGQLLFEQIYKFLTSHGFTYLGEISEAYFYPNFSLQDISNSVFINPKLVKTLS